MLSYVLQRLLNDSSSPSDDWTIEEDLELLELVKTRKWAIERRNRIQCADRYRCIVAMVFKDKVSNYSLENGIKIAIAGFYESNPDRTDGFTKEEMETMALQYFLERKALTDSNSKEYLQKCEDEFNALLAWICESRECSSQELFARAITHYWEEKDGQSTGLSVQVGVKTGLNKPKKA